MSSFFTLDPAVPSQCATQTISWNATRYQEPPFIQVFIPGGRAFSLPHLASNDSTQQTWVVDIPEGTQFLLGDADTPGGVQFLLGDANIRGRMSPLITVTGKSSQGDACLSPLDISTVPLASTTATAIIVASTTATATTKSAQNVNIPAMIGGVVGVFGFLALVCAAIFIYRPVARKIGISPFENSDTHRAPPSDVTCATATHKPPLVMQENLPPPKESANVFPLRPKPPPIVPSIHIASTDQGEVMNVAHGVLVVDGRQTEHVGALAQPRSHPPLSEHNREPEQRASIAHSRADPLASIDPGPPPDRRNSTRRQPSPVTIPDIGVHTNWREDEDGGAGPQAVSQEVALDTRNGLSIRGGMNGDSARRWSQENVVPIAYFTHTDAGAVRLVELPPSYHDLQFPSTPQE